MKLHTENIEKIAYMGKLYLKIHNLNDWKIEFGDFIDSIACCYWYDKKIMVSNQFSLVMDMDFMRGVVLHEVAHALQPVSSRVKPHGKVFKKIARDIGGNPLAHIPISNRDLKKVKSLYEKSLKGK